MIGKKAHLVIKVIFYFVIIVLVILLSVSIINFFKPKASKYELLFLIGFVMMGLPAWIFWIIIFMNSAVGLKIVDNVLIVQLLLGKPLEIPFKNVRSITGIDRYGYKDKVYICYFIDAKEKNFNTSIMSLSFNRKRLDTLIEELKIRVYLAKKESKNQNKESAS